MQHEAGDFKAYVNGMLDLHHLNTALGSPRGPNVKLSAVAQSGGTGKHFATSIVGTKHQPKGIQLDFSKYSTGNKLLLVREKNPHDDNAVAVYFARKNPGGGFHWSKIGYVPRHDSAELCSMYDKGWLDREILEANYQGVDYSGVHRLKLNGMCRFVC